MSRNHIEKLKCPKCGKEGDFTAWESISTDDAPEMKERIRNNDAFMWKCPECGNDSVVFFPVYYYQPDKNFLIHFVPEYSQAAENFMKNLSHDPYDEKTPLKSGCHKRVVFNINQLHEKLLILDEGFDDRVIELMKLFIIAEVMNKDKDSKVNEIYLNKEKDGSIKFALLFDGGDWARTEFIRADYDLIVKKFKVELLSDSEVVINIQWAMNLLNKKM
ncbi:MAG: CpXC domain-containing protein [Ruminococcus sp.]|uniref:CpXC domain-containing protein n=1 Tax=Ruminococcus sp. TaxID=41978 RepID=UPI0025DBEBD6|nr:CpXC domain-containing protein [Ruminococcus sp.]MBR5683385.1 CpXC domain-containing protein [Ruminococcus sp.]